MPKLGTFGFGGPVALVGYMHRDLVERRGWISDTDYREGLALAQMTPGPLAAQLGMYLGYVHYRILGATIAGIAFVLPSFLIVAALGWAYSRFGGLSWMQAVFYGVGAAVVGVIAMSAYKLTKKTLGSDKLLWCIFVVLAAVTVITESEIAWLFIAGGLVNWLRKSPPHWLGRGGVNALASAQAPALGGMLSGINLSLLAQIGVFFAKAGAFVFGSGLAIVPFLYGGVVTEHHWRWLPAPRAPSTRTTQTCASRPCPSRGAASAIRHAAQDSRRNRRSVAVRRHRANTYPSINRAV
ncbi:chromate transporter [Caballeronia jiangsuensis]|nr:chromate transporter [Caballeronia jiangsuensis]